MLPSAALLQQLPDGDQQALLGLCAAARRLQQRLSFDPPQLRWRHKACLRTFETFWQPARVAVI